MLNSTAVSQPAIYVSSLAAVEKLRASPGGAEIIASADVAAGLSLGEYTALVFAGAIGFEDGLRLVKVGGLKRGWSLGRIRVWAVALVFVSCPVCA